MIIIKMQGRRDRDHMVLGTTLCDKVWQFPPPIKLTATI